MALEPHTRCALCGSRSFETLISKPYAESPLSEFIDSYYDGRVPASVLAGARFELARCGRCRFVWQIQQLDPAHTELLYSEWISPHESLKKKEHADIALPSGYCRQIELISRLIDKPVHETSVLDFGMGWGRWCLMARALGFDVVGVETAEDRLAYAQRAGTVAVRSVDELGDRSFDFINAEQVFEHIQDPLGNLQRLVERLAGPGVIRISVPDARRDLKNLGKPGWKPAKDALQPLEHINCFDHQTLVLMAKRAGLRVCRQPFLPGQGLSGKSFRRGYRPWLKSVLGIPYRARWGTTLWFERESIRSRASSS